MLPVHGGWSFLRGVLLLCFAAAVPARAEIVVDGRIDESEWENAIRCEDWRRTVPFARDEPRYRNDVRILSTEHGLAAAFILDQPPQERRIKPRTPRDAEAFIGDTVGLVVDFDANAQIGYEFAVALGGGVRDGLVTNQNKFDRDWDGTWQHAVRESDDQWFVEMLVPWSSISMRESGADTRTIGVYASRYLFERGERYACPGISSDSEVFLSDFRRFTISQYESGATFDFVPYATARADLVNDDTQFKAGADITWKPSQNLRLAATFNPDFGQVESDELVVDFSAIETVFTDKRPFFTENQGIFDLRTPANGQLIYTRRIGAAPDDFSEGSSDIDVAFKLTGTANSLVYGAFMAQERDYRDDFGRLFSAARVALPLEHARVGYLGTWTDHPLLDRDASVNAIDYELTPNDWWRVSGQVIRSDISQAGASTDGYQAWLQTDFNRSAPLTHTLKLLYIDDRFDLNDLGYMERNSLRQVEWETNRRIVGAANPRINGESQRLYAYYRENELGQRLQSRLQLSRTVQYASNWLVYGELRYLTSGVDDLISRGNGPVRVRRPPARLCRRCLAALRRLADHYGRVWVPAGRAGLHRASAADDRLVPDREADDAARPAALLLRRLAAVGRRQPVRLVPRRAPGFRTARRLDSGAAARAAREMAVDRHRCGTACCLPDRRGRAAFRGAGAAGAVHREQPRPAGALPLRNRPALRAVPRVCTRRLQPAER